jgi:hypothetical protein
VPAEAGSDGAKRDCGLWVAVSGRVIAPHAEVIVLAAAVRGVATAAMKGGVRTGPLAGARAGNRFAPASISLALDEDDAEPPRRERVGKRRRTQGSCRGGRTGNVGRVAPGGRGPVR